MKSLVCLLLILMTGCSQSDPSNSTFESSYADIISLGDRDYVNAWELALLDVTEIKEIGKVDNGTVVAEGTPVYSIPSYPDQDVVVVKADSNRTGLVSNVTSFLVYVRNGGDGESYYPIFKDQSVRKIKIYQGTEVLRELDGQEADSFVDLFERKGPHNEFQLDREPQYTVLFIGDNVLGHNYRIMEKDGQFGLAHIESKLPDSIAHYFKQ